MGGGEASLGQFQDTQTVEQLERPAAVLVEAVVYFLFGLGHVDVV